MAVALIRCTLDPMVAKPKCVVETEVFYIDLKPFKNVNLELKKSTASKPQFGFTNIGSEMQRFDATATYF